MIMKNAIDAIVSRLKDGWTHGSECPINDDLNDGSDAPADGSAFVSMDYPVSNAAQKSIGAPGENVFREEGVARVLIHVPAGSGIATPLQWADEVVALFRAKTFDGVQTFAPNVATMDASNDVGSYFVVAVAIPYQFDTLG